MRVLRRRGTEAVFLCASALLLCTAPAAGQSIANRVAAVGDGWAGLEFAARPGVCGEGGSVRVFSRNAPDEFWESGCDAGPVRVLLEVRSRRVARLRTYVGGRWRSDPRLTNLGRVPVAEAADYLLDLVETASDEVAKQAVFPARLADSVDVWPSLLGIARDPSRAAEVRKHVVFWLAQEAGARAVRNLESFVNDSDEDREVKESAIFAISRLRDGQAVPRLLAIAREHPDPHMRKQAIFWLGRSDDPRALALIEELLGGRRP